MTTLSFQVEPVQIPEICSILMKYGIKEIKTKETLPSHILEDIGVEVKKEQHHGLTEEDLKNIEISREQIARGEGISSEEVHKQMWAKYGD